MYDALYSTIDVTANTIKNTIIGVIGTLLIYIGFLIMIFKIKDNIKPVKPYIGRYVPCKKPLFMKIPKT